MKRITWMLAMVGIVATACQREPVWQDLAPAGEAFSVQMPGVPTQNSESSTSSFGTVESHIYELAGEPLYRVRHDDYPTTVIIFLQGTGNLLLARRKKLAHDLKGTLVNEESFSFMDDPKQPGTKFKIELPEERIGHYRIFMVELRMYELAIEGPRDSLDEVAATHFLDSFKLL